jgi:acetyl-CoA synthase
MIVNETEALLQEAIAEKGADTPVAFPNTAYYLPTIMGLTGREVNTLGDLVPVLEQARSMLHPIPSEQR